MALALTLAGCSAGGPDVDDPGGPTAAATSEAEPSAPTPPTADATLPPPDEHSAVGALPEGFPSDLLPVPAGAEILVATYAPEAQAGAQLPYTVSLNVRTSSSVEEVLALYRSSLVAAGFAETTGIPAASLTVETTFSRSAGEELLVVGVLDRDGVRTVTVGGRVRSPA